jgi:hypothetical protein
MPVHPMLITNVSCLAAEVFISQTDPGGHTADELAPWRPTRHKIGRPYVTEYLKHFPMSEPAEDFEDRLDLYCV